MYASCNCDLMGTMATSAWNTVLQQVQNESRYELEFTGSRVFKGVFRNYLFRQVVQPILLSSSYNLGLFQPLSSVRVEE